MSDRAPGAAGRVALSLLAWPLAPPCYAPVNDPSSPALSNLSLSLPIPSPALSKPPVSFCCRSHWLRPGSPLLDSLLDTPPSEARCRQRCCPRPPHAQPALVQYNATDALPCHCHSRSPPRHAAHARGWTFPGQCRPSQSPMRVRAALLILHHHSTAADKLPPAVSGELPAFSVLNCEQGPRATI